MRSFHFPSTSLAALAAAAALAGGLLLAPPATALSMPPAQDEPEKKTMTLSGTAIGPDGSPAAKLVVEVKAPNKELVDPGGADGGGHSPPPDLLAQSADQRKTQWISLGKAITDDDGRFAVKCQLINKPVIQLEIGDKLKTAWLIKPLENKHKDIDLGKVELRAKL